MPVFTQNKKPNTYIFILLLFCSVVVYTSYNKIGLWGIMPFLFIYIILKNGQLQNRDCFPYYIILFLSFCSCIVATYNTIAFNSFFTILTGFIGFFIFFSLSRNIKNIRWLFAVYISYYVGMWLYIIFVLGIANIDISVVRLGTEEGQLNANDVAYMTFYFNVALWMMYALSKTSCKNKLLASILVIVMCIMSIVSALLFASRQVLIIEIPFILGIVYIKIFREKSRKNGAKWVIPIIAILVIFFLYQQVGKEVLLDSLLVKRYENVEEDSRFFLMEKALEVGINNPILGVGCGNFMYYAHLSAFSHCSYTELLANSGIIPAFIYIIWIIKTFYIQYKRYRMTKNVLFLYLALICGMWFLSNFFYVYYTSVWLMGFWGLILGASNTLYRKEIDNQMVGYV